MLRIIICQVIIIDLIPSTCLWSGRFSLCNPDCFVQATDIKKKQHQLLIILSMQCVTVIRHEICQNEIFYGEIFHDLVCEFCIIVTFSASIDLGWVFQDWL